MWKFNGQQRPSFADTPGPGQESVWDYPRPPVLVPSDSPGRGLCRRCYPRDYVYATPGRDGIGKRYMGREISNVMGHQGAAWLERDDREREERTDLLVAELGLKATEVVADIGAGTGYFVFRIRPLGPQGEILAVDIQQEMLDIVAERAADAPVPGA